MFSQLQCAQKIKLPVTVYSLAVVALEVRVRFQISDGIRFTQANKSNVFTTSFCVPKLSSTSRQVTIEFTRLGAQTIKAEIEGFQSSECLDDFYEGNQGMEPFNSALRHVLFVTQFSNLNIAR